MKKLSVLILSICSVIAFGQKVSDFKYVSVPEKFQTFKNSFGLEKYLAQALKAKQYTAVSGDKSKWPNELVTNSCSVLNADVINDKTFLRNRVILQFKDCNDKVILESKGMTDIKEFEEGYQDALKQALLKVSVSNPVTTLSIQPASTATNNVVVTSEVVTVNDTSQETGASRFSNGRQDLQKVQIDANQFLLVKSNSSIPFATFKATTKRDVFRVKLENGNATIGYFENGNIVIEMPQSNGEYIKEVFSGK